MSTAILQRPLRLVALLFAFGALAFALAWVLFVAQDTNFEPAVRDPRSFFVTLLNGITFAGLLFIVASGFSLIFGLMRVVNMAHGSFFLLGGYIAWDLQQRWTGSGFTIPGTEVNTREWIVPALAAAAAIGLIGLVVQQVFLRWNQGNDLQQALITIAISVIIADQVIAHFNEGIASTVTWPGWTNRIVDLRVFDVQYSLARLLVLALGVLVGLALWLWLYRTRTGMVIRAGVDDREMTSALGINIQITFAIAFVVGSALAGFGGVVFASQAGVASGQDGIWLLNSLVVVIIGGMGSLVGAVAGSLLYGLVFNFSSAYLPATATQYSIVFTFILLALVLAFRPRGLFGREG
ncbi:MAG TPA: branched-chain amino acid ABC transporter permease [Gaiellaceae bacterium]|nr:branched-chain amino acid ABC transporter permease [Gaiellaceae bacterium]